MPKALREKTSTKSLRHEPLGTEQNNKLSTKSLSSTKPRDPKSLSQARQLEKDSMTDDVNMPEDDFVDEDEEEEERVSNKLNAKILKVAKMQRAEESRSAVDRDFESNSKTSKAKQIAPVDEDDDEYEDIDEDEENGDEEHERMVHFEGDYVETNEGDNGLTEAEESIVHSFLNQSRMETRTLADIIMEKIREKELAESAALDDSKPSLPPKVIEVYTAVGKLLQHYKSGKLPKALKMLPHLKNWEDVLWLTRPDEWSPAATYACTRIFTSNLNAKMAQRFFNMILLEKCRDDIRNNQKLNYHLYMALKKALFKPAAFYKGIILPLALSQTCTLREAIIFGSVLGKVSIQGNHSAAALLRLVEMPYTGSTSVFVKILLNKKYALPRRVIDALVDHFGSFETESRTLPVLWHQSLLVFAQRYKLELTDDQRERMKQLMRIQQHHAITPEVRRELFNQRP